jgi:L-alanine-DL-glutamate epimerase-like enolase superfamily enzyme
VENGFVMPPDKPGLGIELDADALERFAFSGVEELAVRQKALTAK